MDKHTRTEYHSPKGKNAMEGIMLSEISQTEKDKSLMLSFICGI